MSFIGQTKSLNIKTSQGKTFRLFITEQVGGLWVAHILYTDKSGKIDTQVFSGFTEQDVYILGVEWVLNNIDDQANIDPL